MRYTPSGLPADADISSIPYERRKDHNPAEAALGPSAAKGEPTVASPAEVADRFEKLPVRCAPRARFLQCQPSPYSLRTASLTPTKASGISLSLSLQPPGPKLPAIVHQDIFNAIYVEDPDQSNRCLGSFHCHEISRHHLRVEWIDRTYKLKELFRKNCCYVHFINNWTARNNPMQQSYLVLKTSQVLYYWACCVDQHEQP